MPIQMLRTQPGEFNLGPNILPPSQGDLEEARIRRLLELAKLTQLKQEPLIQQQQIDLQRQRLALEQMGVSETGRHNVTTEEQSNAQLAEAIKQHRSDALLRQAGLDVEQRGQDITARGQDVTARGQDLNLQGNRESIAAAKEQGNLTSNTQVTDTLISHYLSGMSNDPAGDKQNLAKILALRGHPEMLKVLGEQKPQGTGDPLADATLQYMRDKAAGKTTKSTATESTGVMNLLKQLFILPGLR